MSHGVPSPSPERVGVDSRARALRTDAKPTERWPGIVVHQCQPIVRKDVRHLVVLAQITDVAVIVDICFEEVQRAVILLSAHIVCIVLELHPQFFAFVILCDLEGDVAKPLLQCFQGPSLHGRPIFTSILHDEGQLLRRKMLEKVLRREILALDARDRNNVACVLDGPVDDLLFCNIVEPVPLSGFDVRSLALLASPNLTSSSAVLVLDRLPGSRNKLLRRRLP
mmetsp:Transcript_56595/g.184037  ORF Transcript_56595/g.184037 Transcript_56595/m.184037 type:complete len:224 (+) Transcript_56595:915-1586(+)